MNETITEADIKYFMTVSYYSSLFLTGLSSIALIVNAYLLNCSRYLRRPIGVNLRLCVSLTASDALCAFFYILTYTINVIIPPNIISNCWSLLLEVLKLATFFASVFTLLTLALNHYVGIVYPLRRHVITPKTVKSAIVSAYLFPMIGFMIIFCSLPGGFRAPIAFAFFSSNGCQEVSVLRNPAVRWVLVAPFIFVVLLLSFLYLHIIMHMGSISQDSLLTVNNNRSKRSTNRKLLVTLILLAGSACIGWLPTTVTFVLTCRTCVFALPTYYTMWLQIFSQALNVLKLIVDGFIYASRLIEIQYAMWAFHASFKTSFLELFGRKRDESQIPSEFVRYLSETKESRSMRSKRRIEWDGRGCNSKRATSSFVSRHRMSDNTTKSVRIQRAKSNLTPHLPVKKTISDI